MEYPFKLSEIIAGCESGAWLDGAIFESENGDIIKIDRNFVITGNLMNLNDKWGFVKYGY